MTAEVKEALKNAGIDFDSVIARFCGKEDLALRFFRKFPEDPNFKEIQKQLEIGDTKAAFMASHTLKGVAGNLGMAELFAKNNVIVEALRVGDIESAKKAFPDMALSYNKVIETIQAI